MIRGIGLDLADIARFGKMVGAGNEAFVKQLLTDREMAVYAALSGDRRRAEFLAGRFAAKEALMKALGLDLPEGIGMRDIEVLPDRLGKPVLALSEGVRRQIDYDYACSLSITHTATTAGAVVVVEQRDRQARG
ncbi:holo-[acyl-carrier-protein] synthase [Paenibacillus lycopersici]|uniref:Holo-[acyl-carrier-protein] synthase n=1 Tax=Paenibacillus lycopersici TaxID=2704462 RepID=A0A6C0G2N9_9BACL|nr:holo-ACP synthase [Paenibacillus lycopersici]QHT61951.1 holo-[acyl-carrier-protein] synthase [Paenibacillus lycopersici]